MLTIFNNKIVTIHFLKIAIYETFRSTSNFSDCADGMRMCDEPQKLTENFPRKTSCLRKISFEKMIQSHIFTIVKIVILITNPRSYWFKTYFVVILFGFLQHKNINF